MINKDLIPWNVYNNFDSPDLVVSGNVIVGGKEWYNSFMPVYFNLEDVEIIKRLKISIDSIGFLNLSKNNFLVEYYNLLEKYQTQGELLKIVLSLKNRVNNYFNIYEKKLFSLDCDSFDDRMAWILAGLNLMQLYMDPVETFTTQKKSTKVKTLVLPKTDVFLRVLDITPSSEVAYIPMSVLLHKGMSSQSLRSVREYYLNLFEIDDDTLNESVEYSNDKYRYLDYMSATTAQKLVDSTARKIENIQNLSDVELLVYKLQEINGLMTWSKNILTDAKREFRRYDSTNNILYEIMKSEYITGKKMLVNNLTVSTTSGSEKQGMLIYLLNNIRKFDYEKYEMIADKAKSYYQSIFI